MKGTKLLMAPVLPDRVETRRLVLRKPLHSDANTIFAEYTQDLQVALYMIWRPHAALEESQGFIEACIRAWDEGERQAYVLALQGNELEPVGMLEARAVGSTVDIGYVLSRSHWGSGLMPEAIRAVTDAALSSANIYRVQASCDVDNQASARALEKSGFSREGRLERYSAHPNLSSEPRACFMYARCR